ncbi:MAG: lysostaphin resistance A-like protein [Verrucomicrobiota bacterium]
MLGGYLLAVFGGAALLAPWVWHGLQVLAGSWPALAGPAGQPFHRYVNRCLLVLALAGLWPLIRALRLRSWTEVGAVPGPAAARDARAGLAWGALSLAVVAALALAGGGRHLDPDLSAARLASRLASAAASAGVVAVLEELLFRGVVFTALRRAGSFLSATLLSSLVYAMVHFFARPPRPATVGPWSGFDTLASMLHGWVEFRQLVPGLLNLAVAGACLALARERTGGLGFSIGLHAGWIFWLKTWLAFTRETPGANPWFWGTGRLVDGWLALPVLLATLAFLHRRWPGRPPLPQGSP